MLRRKPTRFLVMASPRWLECGPPESDNRSLASFPAAWEQYKGPCCPSSCGWGSVNDEDTAFPVNWIGSHTIITKPPATDMEHLSLAIFPSLCLQTRKQRVSHLNASYTRNRGRMRKTHSHHTNPEVLSPQRKIDKS